MKTIKLIELLNLVYENKAPKKILYKYCEYKFDKETNDYINKDSLYLFAYLFGSEERAPFLEVEIIEDKPKKIEEINFIIKFNEVNKKQKKKLWDFLLDNDFEWDVLKGDENLIQEFYLKQALNEIREYINGAYEMATYTKSVSLDEENIEDILQIIDKVLGDKK